MNPLTRACIAYIAGRLVSEEGSSSIYDHSQKVRISFDGIVTPANVDVCDETKKCCFSGSGHDSRFYLCDRSGLYHVDLKIVDNTFEGYDYSASCDFIGKVNGTSISIRECDLYTVEVYNYELLCHDRSYYSGN
jgi:hypothetical protein